MEGTQGLNGLEIGCSSDGRPPNPTTASSAYKHCFGTNQFLSPSPSPSPSSIRRKKSLIRHASMARAGSIPIDDSAKEFVPVLRSGAWEDIGFRSTMEDVQICVDNFMRDYGTRNVAEEQPNAFYGVFDGHGGKHAADFACHHLPRLIVEDEDFPHEIERAVAAAFLQTDNAFSEACLLNSALASGTTALAAIVFGSSLTVANAGDCRAVLCRRGKAIAMSRDHKPCCSQERKRIEASGGYIYDGYLNGQLNVARALGDWHMDGLKSRAGGPLSGEPEFMSRILTEEDEFLIIGCDGIWDVFMSQNAVDFARRRLQEHNDPALCSKDIVEEAMKRKSGDNLAVVVVCFQTHPPPNLVEPRSKVQLHRSISAEGFKELQGFLDTFETR
ncbi:probable protein phosphatase 2C 22 isoform X2 [Impatiens glandulifera]|uniref:probable protein phosphatase 2C 22 isoform X2 n=1 Tax=Impatiens glandulifera TaxID=253017 RepID=UPI001FB08378|nr:probable protein phosphatase 2C 22 isoform X2 [Impatiens glandulifera]